MIRKFKNGNIVLDIRDDIKKGYYEKTIDGIENFYHNEMYMEDLYVNQINGYLYIVDFNKRLVYDLPRGYLNFLKELLNKGKIKLIPYGKKISKDLLNDLENGY